MTTPTMIATIERPADPPRRDAERERGRRPRRSRGTARSRGARPSPSSRGATPRAQRGADDDQEDREDDQRDGECAGAATRPTSPAIAPASALARSTCAMTRAIAASRVALSWTRCGPRRLGVRGPEPAAAARVGWRRAGRRGSRWRHRPAGRWSVVRIAGRLRNGRGSGDDTSASGPSNHHAWSATLRKDADASEPRAS